MANRPTNKRIVNGQTIRVKPIAGLNDGVVANRWHVRGPGFDTIVTAHFKWQAFNIAKSLLKE